MYHQKVNSNNISERRSKQLLPAFQRKKCRLTLGLFFAHFAMVCMGENQSGDFLTDAFIKCTMVILKEKKILCIYKIILKHQNTHGFELIQETFCKANCSTLFLELFFFYLKHLIGSFPRQRELNRLFTDFSTFLLNIFSL